MAKRIISPKREAERLRQRHQATFILARRQAKKAVEQRLKEDGERLTTYPYRQLRLLADAYFNQHKAELLANASQVIDTWPGFAYLRCANVSSDAQKQNEPNSMSSTVHMSGA
jgi:hypothetical protein